MKKLVSVVLVLALLAMCTVGFAARPHRAPSPTVVGVGEVISGQDIRVDMVVPHYYDFTRSTYHNIMNSLAAGTADDLFNDLNGDAFAAFETVKAYDVVGLRFVGAYAGCGDMTVNMTLPTAYSVEQTVVVDVFTVAGVNYALPATVEENGTLTVEIPEDLVFACCGQHALMVVMAAPEM